VSAAGQWPWRSACRKERTSGSTRTAFSRCILGELVHEPDIGRVEFPFPQRLSRGQMRSLVIAPLLAESRVFGVLVAARTTPHSFTSGNVNFCDS